MGWILFVVAVVLVVWYYQRTPVEPVTARKRARKRPVRKKRGRWHAVAVLYPEDDLPCEAAMSIVGRRYMVAEAPKLPLPECNAASCHCYYRHYEDRRQTERRAGHLLHEGVMQNLGIPDERRLGVDRRRIATLSSIMPT